MKLLLAGTIATGLVIFASVLLILPIYLPSETPALAMLSFEIIYEENLPDWCIDLSQHLKQNRINAAVFFPGYIAEKFPECVKSFSDGVDIGSQTYNYANLQQISDYSLQLAEVKNGKYAVDQAGNLNTKLFKAPYGSTDENIYSILYQSGILADFSYKEQYNKYFENQFIKFETQYYNLTQTKSFFLNGNDKQKPIIIHYDNTNDITKIKKIIKEINSENVRFVNPSELTGIDLTQKRGLWI